jgi:hypothetical protein
MKPLTALCITAALLATACSGQDDSLQRGLARLPRDTTPLVDTVAPPAPLGLPDTVGFPGSADTGALTADTAAAPLSPNPSTMPDSTLQTPRLFPPPRPNDTRPWIPTRRPTLPPPGGDWTAAATDVTHAGGPPATLSTVRTAVNDDFDRVVFQFTGDDLPGYHVEYVDSPVRECGSGRPVPIEGQGWLMIRLAPAQAHTDAGQPTVGAIDVRPDLALVREMRQICDFEGHVVWVLGVAAPNRYRVLELRDPARIAVDVLH